MNIKKIKSYAVILSFFLSVPMMAQTEDFDYEDFSLDEANANENPANSNGDFLGNFNAGAEEEEIFNDEPILNLEQSVSNPLELGDVDGNAANEPQVVEDTNISEPAPLQSSETPILEDTNVAAKDASSMTMPEVISDFVGVPPLPGSRRVMASEEAPNEYQVEMGDTLFDICDQLIDEADYWPKLWALNPEIKNPHFIFPGMKLKFYPGDKDTPPFLQVMNEQDTVPVSGDGALVQTNVTEILGDGSVDNLLVEDLKEEPVEVVGADQLQVPVGDEGAVRAVGSSFNSSAIYTYIPAFITRDPISPLAKVVGGSSGQNLSAPGSSIVVTQISELSPGTTYSVVRDGGQIMDSNGEFVGHRYDHVASVKVAANLPGSFSEAKVMLSRLGVRGGDHLIEYRSTRRSLPMGVSTANAADSSGVVVAFENRGQQMGGKGSIVFIQGQVSPGSLVPVYQLVGHQSTSLYDGERPAVERVVGYLHILESSDSTSVGYAVKAARSIKLGDAVGKG